MATETKKKKKRKSAKLAPWAKLLCVLLLAVSCFFIYSIGKEIMTTLTLRSQLSDVKERLQEVQDENEYLIKTKEKLQDPDYVQSYARGNYMLSKDGEQIFYLPEDDNK